MDITDLDELASIGYTTYRNRDGLKYRMPNDILKRYAPELLTFAQT